MAWFTISFALNSELVVLSACHSIGKDTAYGDWLAGLTRSFLMAGARGVVCTLWELDDDAALMLMPDLYRQGLAARTALPSAATTRRTVDVPRALQGVKLTCLKSPGDCHPAVWSGVVYHGPPGGED